MSQTEVKKALESIKDNLVNGEGGTVKLPACDLIGIYFSAHWCPPCRGFTPELVKFYNAVKMENENEFQIVFVSLDRDEASFKEYFKTMPWLALKFDDENKKNIADKFQVSGIPMLVVMDAAGNIKDSNGRAAVNPDEPQEAMKKWRK